jgi:hypothetical protein
MIYINYKGGEGRETVDEFETRKEAKEALAEYVFSDPQGEYWISPKACKGWETDAKIAKADSKS